MAQPTNHWKLGLFVLLGVAGALVATIAFGAQSMRKETVAYYTYYNESVQGLEIGSPVKFRGVIIGHVADIEIAPDHRQVEVKNDLDVADIKRMGLTGTGHGKKERFLVPADLRAQLGSQGITGVKFVSIDFFDPKSNPPPELGFAPPENYIPAAVSMMKNLEDTITKAMDRLPEMVDAVVAIMGRVDRMLMALEKGDVTGKATQTMAHVDEAVMILQTTLTRLDSANIGGKAGATLDQIQVASTKMNALLDRLDGDKGLLSSVQHASDAFGELGRSGRGTTHDLEQTLRDVSEAADSIRSLADALEHDPDMLLKGRAASKGKSR